MNKTIIHTEPTKYLHDNKTWLYKFMHAFFNGFIQNSDYYYDLKPTKNVNFFPITSYTYDTFSVLNYDYDYFCCDMNKLALHNGYFSVSAASSGVFWKHTATEFETGFDYFGARYYDSDLSVWLSVDPLADKYPWMSPFMYTAGNPVMLVDPDGKKIIWYNSNGSCNKDLQGKINELRKSSPSFSALYDYLDMIDKPILLTSDPDFLKKLSEAKGGTNSIISGYNINVETFSIAIFGNNSKSSTFAEELFHVFQNQLYGNSRNVAEIESEAKLFDGVVMEEEFKNNMNKLKGANVIVQDLGYLWAFDRDVLVQDMFNTNTRRIDKGSEIEKSYFNFLDAFENYYKDSSNATYHGDIRHKSPDAYNCTQDYVYDMEESR